MSEVIRGVIDKSTAQDICDAVKEKEGSTEGVPFNTVADRIRALQIGGGENKLAQLADGTLTEITAEDLADATNIREYAFYEYPALNSIVIPDSVMIIKKSAFSYCDGLTSVIIGNGVSEIESYAFWYCTNLTNVIIGNSVVRMSGYTFDSCTKLTSLTIPSSITKIGSRSLSCGSSSNKATFTFLRTTPPQIESNTFNANAINKIIVPAGSGQAYKTATNWANIADYIEEASV